MLARLLCLLSLFAAAAEPRPSFLLGTDGHTVPRFVDLTLLEELHNEGFQPDYLEAHEDFTWERIRNYNVLVLFDVPAADETPTVCYQTRGPRQAEFIALVERFLAAGGGVFYMADIRNADQFCRPLIEPWGARLPYEYYLETSPERIATMPRMRGIEALCLTDAIAESPISTGVHHLWWPYGKRFSASFTGPIAVSNDWQVVVRGSSTSRSDPVTRENTARFSIPPPDPLVRPGGVPEPAMLAIRDYRSGRILLCNQLPVHSLGQGTKWLFDRRSLSRGLNGIPSDWGMMIRNSLRWLAAPSLANGQLGGYTMAPERLVPTNLRPGARDAIDQRFGKGFDVEYPPDPSTRMFRGVIGARTTLSIGSGTVADYAVAAKQAELDFVVFLEDFAEFSAAKLAQLDAQCKEASDDTLQLIPGYTIDNNIGNHMFFYGYGLKWPPDYVLVPGKPTILNVQMQDADGNYIVRRNTHQWMLQAHDTRGPGRQQIGYYNFDDPHAPQMYDIRDASAAAVFYYDRDGRLADERIADHLTTAQCGMPLLPLVVSDIMSPAALVAAVAAGQALTCTGGQTVANIDRSLGWTNQYDGPHVVASEGPMIREWPGFYRCITFGAEPFVVAAELLVSPLHVTSSAGLKEIVVYDGRRRIRRYLPGGAREFREILQLPAVIQQNLVVVVTDVNGRRAVSSAQRSRKEGSLGISFCGDHVNDCGTQGLLAHGPGMQPFSRIPQMSRFEAGHTWDGGPEGIRPVIRARQLHPWLASDQGQEGDRPFNNLPLIECSDDQGVVVRSVLDEVYDERVPALNAWNSWGPKEPSKLVTSVLRYREWNQPVIGVVPEGWAAGARRAGAVVSVFQNTVIFKTDQTVEHLRVAGFHGSLLTTVHLATGTVGKPNVEVRNLMDLDKALRLKIATGDWFCFFSPEASNDVLYVNRGDPLLLRVQLKGEANDVVAPDLFADIAGTAVKAGETRRYELFAVTDPLDAQWTGASRCIQVLDYLAAPDGLEIRRGERVDSLGIFDVAATDGAVELYLPQPTRRLDLTLPVRVRGLNPNWSAGVWQRQGYSPGYYSDGTDVYSGVGFDLDGNVHAAVFPDYAAATNVVVGHPVIADNVDLVLEVAARAAAGGGMAWHVAVNNPTDTPIAATLHRAMALPGLDFPDRKVTVPAGANVVLLK